MTTNRAKPARQTRSPQRKERTTTKLDALIAEATVDAFDEWEQVTGFYTMLEEHLALPFKTEVLGVEVTVERFALVDNGQIVAVCARGGLRQRIPITELPLPSRPPEGSEWIDAYRRWVRVR